MNLISTSIPNRLHLVANGGLGSNSTARGHLSIGNSHKNVGWLIETFQLQTDGFKQVDFGGRSGFQLQDYMAKLRFNTNQTSSLYQEIQFKIGHTDQDSDETYLGLTEADFRANPLRRYAGSQLDNIQAQHEEYQLRHFIGISERLDLTTIAYRNEFGRNWYKLEKVDGTAIADILGSPESFDTELGILRGADSAPDTLTQRNNNRDYYSTGIQSVLGWRLDTDATSHQLEVGIRYHEDKEDRFQSDDGFQMYGGRKLLTSVGAPGSQTNRVNDARALALFAQDRIQLSKLALTPGLRYESIDLIRTDYSTTDPYRLVPTRIRDTNIRQMVAGLGLDYELTTNTSLFGGIHMGFAPPGPGVDAFTQAEESLNYELGLRFDRAPFRGEAIGFFSDYSNLLGRDTLSTGGTGSGDLFNGGEVHLWGIEASATYDLGKATGLTIGVPLSVAYTYTHGEFRNSFSGSYKPWGDVEVGDRLPYLPAHQLHAAIGLHQRRWSVSADISTSSAMRAIAGHGRIDLRDRTDAHAVLDVGAERQIVDGVRLYANLQNVLDETYIVARRPAGVRPGLPRTLVVGLRLFR